jgi:hypothetical protein
MMDDDSSQSQDQDRVCPIRWTALPPKNDARLGVLSCDHEFWRAELVMHLQRSPLCPLCKAPVTDIDQRFPEMATMEPYRPPALFSDDDDDDDDDMMMSEDQDQDQGGVYHHHDPEEENALLLRQLAEPDDVEDDPAKDADYATPSEISDDDLDDDDDDGSSASASDEMVRPRMSLRRASINTKTDLGDGRRRAGRRA